MARLYIKNLVQELNIYESIYKNALTGSIVIIDAQNLIAKLEIQGLERISFKLSTPGANNTRDMWMLAKLQVILFMFTRSQIENNLHLVHYSIHYTLR